MRMIEKLKIFHKSFQKTCSKRMDIENQEFIHCEDGEYRVNCDFCDNSCIERFYKNHSKSKTHTNHIRKREKSITFI